MNLVIFALFLLVMVVAAATGAVWHRGCNARQAIRVDVHARQLALDQRCDALGANIERLDLGLRLTRLSRQVALAHDRGLLSHGAANRLDGLVLGWQAEGLDRPADGPSA